MFKKIFYLAFILLASISSFSQTIDAFKYQAVLRSGGTQVIANQNVGLRFSIREGNPNGVEVYSEEHFVVTNPIGLVNLEIGNGQNVFGDLRILNWGDQRYFVRTELDASGGSNFVFLGVSELLAVPYAFKAGDVVQKQDLERTGDSVRVTDNPNATWLDLGDLRDNTDDQSLRFQNGLVILTREFTEDTADINPYVQARLNQFGLDSVLNVNNQAAGQDIVGLGKLGVGTTVPQYAIDVLGRVSTDSLQVRSNAQTGYVLTSDANGVATWQASPIQGLDSVLRVSNNANGQIIQNLDSLGIGGTPQYTLHIIDTVDNTSPNYNYSIFGQISGGTVAGRFRAGMYLELNGTNGENIAIDGTSSGASVGINTGVGGYARGSSTYNRGIQASGDGGQTAVGIEALANGGAQQTVAVFGQAANSGGDQAGVRGVVDSAGTTNAGRNWGVNGFVLSESTVPNGNIGVEGAAQGSHTGDNVGVIGVATNAGNNTGGLFSAGSSSVGGTNFSIGAQGNAQQANSGFNYGLYGRAANSTAINRGVVGDLSGATNRNGVSGLHLQDAAVYGFTNSTGWSTALLGRANGSNASDTNVALLGYALNGAKNYALWTEEGDAMFNDTAIFNYGSPQNGYVLTSDANGRATWQPNAADSTRLTDGDNDTRIEVEQSADDDLIRFTVRGTEYFRMDTGRIEFFNTGESVFIGEGAGLRDDKTANAGVFVGYRSGYQNTSGEFNTFVGNLSGSDNTIGSANSFFGNGAGLRNTTGGSNSFFGSGAGSRNTTGGSNAFFGQNAGLNNTTGVYNVFLGAGAAFANTTGGGNVYIGREAAFDATTASDNVVIGASADRTNLSGVNNVIVGTHAGGGAQHSKSGAVYIGAYAGGADTTDNKLYIDNSNTTQPLIYGDFASDSLRLNAAVEIRDELYIPTGAGNGRILTSDATGKASWQTMVADTLDRIQIHDSTKAIINSNEMAISFNNNTAFRFLNNNKIHISSPSTFIGNNAGASDTTHLGGVHSSTGNVGIGNESMVANVNGNYNVAVGSSTMSSTTSSSYNTAIGAMAFQFGTGSSNTIVGAEAFGGNANGGTNTVVGFRALTSASGSNNVALGSQSLNVARGSSNVAVGTNALQSDTIGNNNVALGHLAGGNAYGSNNIFLGYLSGQNETGSNKLFIENSNSATPLIYGDFASDSLRVNGSLTVRDDLFVDQANAQNGYVLTSDASGKASWQKTSVDTLPIIKLNDSNYVEVQSAQTDIVIDNLTYFQFQKGRLLMSGLGNNVFIGNSAGNLNTISGRDVAIGLNALNTKVVNGLEDIAIGEGALQSYNATQSQNIAIGYRSLNALTGQGRNVAYGYGTFDVLTSGIDNVGIGFWAGQGIATGDQNVFVGSQAGRGMTSGSRNVILGDWRNGSVAHSASGVIKIGYLAGKNDTSDNKLFIENSDSQSPLIYGDFASDSLRVNGSLTVRDDLFVDQANAQNGYVLTSNANGLATWQAASTSTPQNIDSVLAVGSDAGNDTIYNLRMLGLGTSAPTASIDVVNNTDNFNLSIVNSKVTGTGEVKGVFSSVTGTGSSNKFGLYGEAINGTGINYGVFGEARRTGGVGTTYAIYGTASGAANNYAAYFDQGNVFINNNLGIGVSSPARRLDVAGDAYIDSVFTDSLVAQFGAIDSLRVGNAYSFPSTAGTAGQVLEYNGSGDLIWANVSGSADSTRLTDADNDTRITVENSADEDYIRFFTRGREYMTIDTSGKIGINMNNPAARLCLWDTLFSPGKLVGINSFVYGDGIGSGDTLIANQAYATGDGEFKFGYYSKVYGVPSNSYYAFYGEATGGSDNFGLLTKVSSNNNSYGARVEVEEGNYSIGYSASVEAEGNSGTAQGMEIFVDSARFGTGVYMEIIGQSLGNAETKAIDFITRDADFNYGIIGQVIGNSSGSDEAVGISVSASQAQQTVGIEAEAYGSAGGDTAVGIYGYAASADLTIAGLFEAEGYGGGSDTVIGLYSSATSGSTNYAGYFDFGNVLIGDTLILPTGATNGYVLTSDADGKATWQAAASGSSVWDTNATSVFLPNQKNLRIGGNDTALSDIHLGAFGHLQWADLGGDSSMFMSQNLYYDGTNLKYTLDGPSSLFFAAEEEAGIIVSRQRPAGTNWNINNDALTSFRVDGGGVGINTDTPDHALDIEPVTDSIAIIIRSNANDASSILMSDSTNTQFMGLRPAEYLKGNYQIVFPDTAPSHNQAMVYDSSSSAFVWVTQSSAACPTGMDLVGGSLCIDNTERGAATWFVADSTCTSLGYQLADFGDWYGAVANATLTNETNDWEWVRNVSQNNMMIVGNGGITNRSFQDPSLTATYRCTIRK